MAGHASCLYSSHPIHRPQGAVIDPARSIIQYEDRGPAAQAGEYSLEIVHLMGTGNGPADGLSRIPVKALEIGLIGKEQSYLSAMTMTRDD